MLTFYTIYACQKQIKRKIKMASYDPHFSVSSKSSFSVHLLLMLFPLNIYLLKQSPFNFDKEQHIKKQRRVIIKRQVSREKGETTLGTFQITIIIFE